MTDDGRLVETAYLEREHLLEGFFTEAADRIAACASDLASRFAGGGRLLAFGEGAAVTDAQHIAVEFVHPVIVGKRALPALALPNDPASMSSFWSDPASHSSPFARHLEIVGRDQDIAVGIAHDPRGSEALIDPLLMADERGMLTIFLGAGTQEPNEVVTNDVVAEHVFAIPSDDPFIIQEVQETLYHVLWELVHVFFEHGAVRGGDIGRSSFLYPFLGDGAPDVGRILADVASSAKAKASDVIELRRTSLFPDRVVAAAAAIRERVTAGGKILTLGNGGSATDAEDLAVDLLAPPQGLDPVNAISLCADAAVITAVGNDVGFDNVFSRQVIAFGNEADVAIAISTSGGSRNVLAAMEEARRRGLLTVGLAGYGGGPLADICDEVLIVDADYVPRVQEAQATQYHCLRRLLG